MYLISMILHYCKVCRVMLTEFNGVDDEGGSFQDGNLDEKASYPFQKCTKQPETSKKKFSTLKHPHFSKIPYTSLNMNKIPTSKRGSEWTRVKCLSCWFLVFSGSCWSRKNFLFISLWLWLWCWCFYCLLNETQMMAQF